MGKSTVTHLVLVISECPYPLLGGELLQKLQATISFEGDKAHLTIDPPDQGSFPTRILLSFPLLEDYLLRKGLPPDTLPTKKATGAFPHRMGKEQSSGTGKSPMATTTPAQVRQYPMSLEVLPHTSRLWEAGILISCQFPWNTPLLPVLKHGTKDYRMVQNLREINKWVKTIHLIVPNPYILLSFLPPKHQFYTILDLGDAPISQPIFAFEWMDPVAGFSGQLTWTQLPQGFWNSPILFEALSSQLLTFWHAPTLKLSVGGHWMFSRYPTNFRIQGISQKG